MRLDIDLSKAVFGAERGAHRRHRGGLHHAVTGTAPSPAPDARPATICKGGGEVQQIQRSFLGQVMTARPCVNCQGFGSILTDPCHECSGDGRVRTRRTLKLKVPAGVDTGTRIQLTGEGEVGPGGGPAGDLYVEIRVGRHDIYTRRGDDLHCRVELPMTAAALGTSCSCRPSTAAGPRDQAGTQSGDVAHPARTRRDPPARHAAAATCSSTRRSQTPTRLTRSRRSCSASSRRSAARRAPRDG